MISLFECALLLLDRIRTDERFPDIEWARSGLDDDPTGPHPVSGLPLYFGARKCPQPVTRVRWLHAGADGARFEWIRDRVDPVFHVPNRHVCRFLVTGLSLPAPFSPEAAEVVTHLPAGIVETLDNALLQDSELGFLQCLEADRSLTVESITRGMIGPLWSAVCAPAQIVQIFHNDPGAALLHLPLDCTLREPGPSIADDPLAPLYGTGTELEPAVSRLRARLPYRVLRRRRAFLRGARCTLEALKDLFPGLSVIPVDTGES
ncbi:hypothetical protein KJ975_08205 [Myxococcota bacterium]|nr:hypothetical protein [Myxococcota bacterium]